MSRRTILIFTLSVLVLLGLVAGLFTGPMENALGMPQGTQTMMNKPGMQQTNMPSTNTQGGTTPRTTVQHQSIITSKIYWQQIHFNVRTKPYGEQQAMAVNGVVMLTPNHLSPLMVQKDRLPGDKELLKLLLVYLPTMLMLLSVELSTNLAIT